MNLIKRVFFGLKVCDTKKSFPTQDHYCMSYHDPRSITWSWVVNWTPPWRAKNRTSMVKLRHKFFGYFYIEKQNKMIKKEYL